MDNTGRPSYVFQFFCAPGTPVEPTRAEPARCRGGDSRSRRRRSCATTPPKVSQAQQVAQRRCTLCFSTGNFRPTPRPQRLDAPCHALNSFTTLSPKNQERLRRTHSVLGFTLRPGCPLSLSRTHHHLATGSFQGTCADLLSRLLHLNNGEESRATHNPQGALSRV